MPNIVNKKERAYLLSKVCGWFEAHQMSALVSGGPNGPSGPNTVSTAPSSQHCCNSSLLSECMHGCDLRIAFCTRRSLLL